MDLYLSEFHKYIETVMKIIQRSLRFTLSPREATDNGTEMQLSTFFCELNLPLKDKWIHIYE